MTQTKCRNEDLVSVLPRPYSIACCMHSDDFGHTAHDEIVCDSSVTPRKQGIRMMYNFVALLAELDIAVSGVLQLVGIFFPKRLTDLVQAMCLAQ